ncbi:MAG: phospho-N-acetylmuramoyl-pentapeptide-transferase [Chitinophagaceae bacterium]|jgi:phospho-N-acetylmuramoyl-pentapeptide-transferase|nr:phospho-N-acetylmuramoyl-pentapeptide-transferase [Candidatus Levybacteria bacterium]MBP9815442.1 phospho-N-acetylmuramoyl-pentapeptide-transferase [Candidatus Levybacteria bacterium]MCC6448288.1 phospho-N-acetylmuramoyl-pentapeptide-transferase [Chitinophagaceae bacterium]HMS22679.1 phospho-N-acetylmuramoyl-pentapeptide-transferase [Candidatus Levybacteria bacterium]
MDKIFGLAILSFTITAILLVPFIDFLYKIKLQRKHFKSRDMFNKRTPIFDKFSRGKVGTPFGGGILIIIVVTVISLWTYGIFSVEVKFWELFVLLFAFIGFGALGFYDDLRKILNRGTDGFFGLSFKYKFLLQWVLALIIGAIFYYQLGYSFIYLHWLGKVSLGLLFIPFAAFVIVSFVNAFNITDGLDGLASGVFLIALIAFLTISHALLDLSLGLFISILIGAIAAFLYFNIFPARLWLGDVGSLSLGAALAVIGLLTGKTAAIGIIGGVFVVEVASSLIQILGKRILGRKLLPVAPLHLYFMEKGWGEPKTVMRAWLFAIIFAVIGLYIAFIA